MNEILRTLIDGLTYPSLENPFLHILINYFVEGHWKDIISRPHLQDKGV